VDAVGVEGEGPLVGVGEVVVGVADQGELVQAGALGGSEADGVVGLVRVSVDAEGGQVI
jgi:hypothetical protein